MKLLRSIAILMMLAAAISLSACSQGSNPVNPNGAPESFGVASENGRNIISAYEVTIDPQSETVTMVPVDRASAFHFPLTDLYPNVLAVTGFNFGPPFWADIKLTHPFPGSGISAYDARVIAVLPANTGVSFTYPTINITGNNKALLSPLDGYTKLWDKGLAGNVNPFVAYFKSQPFRVWSSTGTTSETIRWTLDLAGFGGGLSFYLVCDVSTNFPAAPQPIVDNCKEPASLISCTVGTGMIPTGGGASIDVNLLDWQGPAQATTVVVECPLLFNGIKTLAYTGPGPGADQYIYHGTISNDKLAPVGDYNVMIGAQDNATAIAIYQEFKGAAHVAQGGGPGNWQLDPDRGNVDASVFTQYPVAGSDICVIDSGETTWDGVLMYDEYHQVTRMDLDLTDANFYGYGYLPWDDDPANPHPNPDDPMPAGRIDGANNGYVARTWIDPHKGIWVQQISKYLRNDNIVAIFIPIGEVLSWHTGMISWANDNVNTPEYNEADEQFQATEVWDEADSGVMTYPIGYFRSGTEIFDIDNNLWNPIGMMGALADPYHDGTNFVFDWGAWVVTGPPMNEVQAVDASQDATIPWQYWAYSGPGIGPGIVAWYDKETLTYMDGYLPSDANANVLDFELIPLQNPPLDINGNYQYNDWGAVLLDNGTIEIFDPSFTAGLLVETIDLSVLTGVASYIDVADKTADIFVSHADGAIPYVSVFTVH
jgi:hypothetical protein